MRGLFLTDVEIGKKDDDHKLAAKNGGLRVPSSWQPARGPLRRSIKRIAALLGVAFFVYLFIHNIPTDIGPRRSLRPIYNVPGSASNQHPPPSERGFSPESKHGSPNQVSGPLERTYNGPPRFFELGASLHAITSTKGGMTINRNVLFAASSLKSAAALLPIACSMGIEKRNYVHFALMSRSEIKMEELQKVNGIDEGCQIIFHDARPDHAIISTEERMEKSAFRAFHHIHMYMHPQAIFVDGSESEEAHFLRGARSQARATGNTLIELPERSARNIMWLTKLDSSSLRVWNKYDVDILIHAIPGASGSLIRLLKSLSKADFTSSYIPHLTIELPHDIDPPTKRFLENFQWPPAHIYNPTNAKYISIRHRIPRQSINEEESSVRFLESFWPGNPQLSHILVLSQQVELSPQFFHYLRYTLLEYRYSTTSRAQRWDARLLGISLEQPHVHLNGKDKLSLPLRVEDSGDLPTPFLWQAPTSNAILFFGEKWMELHDFVSRSLEAQQHFSNVPSLLSDKSISTRHPSWLKYVLRLARVRGYLTLYPGEDIASNLATVHNELNHLPEEYATPEESSEAIQKFRQGSEITLAPVSLLQGLPDNGVLSPFSDLPMLTWTGEGTDVEGLDELAAQYATEFKEKVG
ncbi:uncharacterized protein BCR38DRAFT_318001, partial [Pseudomassariella vexata]